MHEVLAECLSETAHQLARLRPLHSLTHECLHRRTTMLESMRFCVTDLKWARSRRRSTLLLALQLDGVISISYWLVFLPCWLRLCVANMQHMHSDTHRANACTYQFVCTTCSTTSWAVRFPVYTH